jgi:transcriptional regulator with XRE-family HTH domain
MQPSTMVDYGERLKKAMEARSKSAHDVATYLGVSYQAVKKVLDGKTKCFSAPNHEDVCQFLGVSGRWLAKDEGEMHQEAPRAMMIAGESRALYARTATAAPTEDEWQIEGKRILAGLSAEDRRAAVLQLRVFVAQLHTPGNGEGVPVAA